MKPKRKKCKQCKKLFEPWNSLTVVCSPKCAIIWSKTKDSKEHKAKAVKIEHIIKKKAFVSRDKPYWTKKLQAEFNKFIRNRDKLDPCISSGIHHEGQYHAGHYRSIGAHPELRFEEDNCHKQSSFDNNHKSGNLIQYRLRLIEKIGLDRVLWLEGPHDAKKYTIDDLKQLLSHYKAKNKEMM